MLFVKKKPDCRIRFFSWICTLLYAGEMRWVNYTRYVFHSLLCQSSRVSLFPQSRQVYAVNSLLMSASTLWEPHEGHRNTVSSCFILLSGSISWFTVFTDSGSCFMRWSIHVMISPRFFLYRQLTSYCSVIPSIDSPQSGEDIHEVNL